MIRTVTLLTVLVLISSLAFSQSNKFLVSGIIYDELNQPLPYASVALKSIKSEELIKGAMTDVAGYFELMAVPKGLYLLEVSMMGYEKSIQTITISTNIKIDEIHLQVDATALGEVTITARKKMLTRKTDRLVMNIADNAAFSGNSSWDLFSMAPGVFVNNGNISINGVWGTKVMVNGRLLKLSGNDLKNYLQNLKADDIESLEIIAHPSAEFDAEGSGGILNIVLKKNTNAGLNGYIGVDYSNAFWDFPAYKPNVGLNYKKDKLEMSIGYSYLWGTEFQDVSQNRDFPDQGKYTSIIHSINQKEDNGIRFSTTYDFNKNQYLGIDYTGQYGYFLDSIQSVADIVFDLAQKNIQSTGFFPSYAKTNYTNVGLNYSLMTDTLGSKLTFLTDYTYNDKNAYSGNNSKTYDAFGSMINDTLFTFNYPSISKIITADLKFNKKLLPGLEYSFGGKLSSTDINNSNAYDIVSNGNTQANVNAFDYEYKERIYAGFAAISGNLLNIDFNIGLRGENSEINGQVIGDAQDTIIKRNYFNLFPSVFVQKELSKDGNNGLNFAYNKRVSRPSYLELNPYKYYIDNYSVQTGNPLLNPEFTNSFELGYLYKKQYNASFNYSRSKDVINQVIENDDHRTLTTILNKNTGKFEVYSLNFSIPIALTKWWRTTNNLQLSHTASQSTEFNLSKNSLVFQSQQDISLSRGLSLSLNGFYTPGIVQGNILIGSFGRADIGLQKKFLKNNLIAKLAINDILNTHIIKASSIYNGTVINIIQKDQTRKLALSILYNFNFGKSFKTRNLNKSNQEERKRL